MERKRRKRGRNSNFNGDIENSLTTPKHIKKVTGNVHGEGNSRSLSFGDENSSQIIGECNICLNQMALKSSCNYSDTLAVPYIFSKKLSTTCKSLDCSRNRINALEEMNESLEDTNNRLSNDVTKHVRKVIELNLQKIQQKNSFDHALKKEQKALLFVKCQNQHFLVSKSKPNQNW